MNEYDFWKECADIGRGQAQFLGYEDMSNGELQTRFWNACMVDRDVAEAKAIERVLVDRGYERYQPSPHHNPTWIYRRSR